MQPDRVFQVTFIISLITHSIILLQAPALNLNIFSQNKKESNLEVSYINTPSHIKESLKNLESKKDALLKKLPSNMTISKAPLPSFEESTDIFKKGEGDFLQRQIFTKPLFTKPEIIAVKKKITLPPIDMDKINNPTYISYYQIVREKIRRAAYQNYRRTEIGEVYLSFTIAIDGSLKKIQLVDERSSSNQYLREVAQASIKEASPFPNFPKELDYPQLSFNVVISFEVE